VAFGTLVWVDLSGAVKVASPDRESHLLAFLSGPCGETMFTVISSSHRGRVTENNYADPRSNKNGLKDPRMRTDRYHAFPVGAIGLFGDQRLRRSGRPDILAVSSTESCRLFRNLGDRKLEDVTEKAGAGAGGEEAGIWKQGLVC
jgi:hypothetical protein